MDQHISEDIGRYSRILGLSTSQVDAAGAAWTVIAPHMPDLVEDFYAHLFANGNHHVFADRNVGRLKRSQHHYWRTLFSGSFDAAYRSHIHTIGVKHRDAGVGLADYIASYGWFSERFFRIIARHEPPAPFQRHSLLIAMNKVMYLDMMIAAASLEVGVVDV